jgi:hypothetical protein
MSNKEKRAMKKTMGQARISQRLVHENQVFEG